jgi:hypothetical protein
VSWMHLSIGLHLVHAAVVLGAVPVALLRTVGRFLLRLHIQQVPFTSQRLWGLLRRWRLESTCVAVDGGRIGRVRAGTPVEHRGRAEGTTPRRGGVGRRARVRLDLRQSRQSLSRDRRPWRVLGVIPTVDGASGVDRRYRWQLQLFGVGGVLAMVRCSTRFESSTREGLESTHKIAENERRYESGQWVLCGVACRIGAPCRADEIGQCYSLM